MYTTVRPRNNVSKKDFGVIAEFFRSPTDNSMLDRGVRPGFLCYNASYLVPKLPQVQYCYYVSVTICAQPEVARGSNKNAVDQRDWIAFKRI